MAQKQNEIFLEPRTVISRHMDKFGIPENHTPVNTSSA